MEAICDIFAEIVGLLISVFIRNTDYYYFVDNKLIRHDPYILYRIPAFISIVTFYHKCDIHLCEMWQLEIYKCHISDSDQTKYLYSSFWNSN